MCTELKAYNLLFSDRYWHEQTQPYLQHIHLLPDNVLISPLVWALFKASSWEWAHLLSTNFACSHHKPS